MIAIYNCKDKYLYEIIEDYKERKIDEEKNEIFNSFCSSIWSSDNHRRKYKKTMHFNVRKDLLDTDVGQVFETWSEIEYTYYKSMTKEQDWCNLIRQKVNNIYTRYFDKDVILGKEYMNLLKKPRLLYYDWLSGTEMDADELTTIIDDTIADSIKVKEKLQCEKMTLSWDKYKNVINGFFKRTFENCKLIEDYEDKASVTSMYDFFTEDHFYVRYFNKCLDGSIRDYQKRIDGLPMSSRKGYKRCQSCGKLIQNTGNKKKYCDECKSVNNLERYKRYNKKRTTNRKS